MPDYKRGEIIPKLGVYQFTMAEPSDSEESDLLPEDEDEDKEEGEQRSLVRVAGPRRCRSCLVVLLIVVLSIIVVILTVGLVLEGLIWSKSSVPFPETPPMGWTSALMTPCDAVSDHQVRDVVQQLEMKRLKQAGYHYVLVDGCWQGLRNKTGILQPKPPFDGFTGMVKLGRWLSQENFKFGIATGIGKETCHGNPGSGGHEVKDFETFTQWWRVSYIKADSCNLPSGTNESLAYMHFIDATKPEVHQVILHVNASMPPARSVSGVRQVVPWVPLDDWEDLMGVVDQYVRDKLWLHTGPGSWNDMGPLHLAQGRLLKTEYQAQFALWCAMKSQLFIGEVHRQWSGDEVQLVTNSALININQDKVGEAVKPVYQAGISSASSSRYQVVAESCLTGKPRQQWYFRNDTNQLVNKNNDLCLTEDPFGGLSVRKCDSRHDMQKWTLRDSSEANLFQIQSLAENKQPKRCVTLSTHKGVAAKVRPCNQRQGIRNWQGSNQPWHGFNDAFSMYSNNGAYTITNTVSLCLGIGGTADHQIFAGGLSYNKHVIIFLNRDVYEHKMSLHYNHLSIRTPNEFPMHELLTDTRVNVKNGLFETNVEPRSVKVFLMTKSKVNA